MKISGSRIGNTKTNDEVDGEENKEESPKWPKKDNNNITTEKNNNKIRLFFINII